jgi:hypothetical protein
LSELREGLAGQLRSGAIPVSLPALALMTAPFAAIHSKTCFQGTSQTSISIQRELDEFTIDVALALAVGCSIAAMMATRTVHPPAGSNPVIIFLGHSGWAFLLFPVVSGALCVNPRIPSIGIAGGTDG